jgi:hypothetical protein
MPLATTFSPKSLLRFHPTVRLRPQQHGIRTASNTSPTSLGPLYDHRIRSPKKSVPIPPWPTLGPGIRSPSKTGSDPHGPL